MSKTRVLIVDDSALMRELLRTILARDPEIEVVDAVSDPIKAAAACERLQPDVMTLDVEMPRMSGLQFLEHLMRTRPMPVIMVSSLTERGADVTLRALALGAVDFVSKPKLDIARGTFDIGAELVAKVKGAARARVRRVAAALPPAAHAQAPVASHPSMQRLVAIGASTGGTEALTAVLTRLPPDAPAVVIVQHMPPVFTQRFAERLDGQCRIRVREARDGEEVLPGTALLAPGGDHHMEILGAAGRYVVRLRVAPPLNHHRPSVDVLFQSCAKNARANAVGVLLTGMGADGAEGLLAMRFAGARTMAQDEATSVVFGMPKEAIARGAAERVLPLDEIGPNLLRAARERGQSTSTVTQRRVP
jgi:two-component system, chemotaxis family, protein-glutamate methylesterase/glutaminase